MSAKSTAKCRLCFCSKTTKKILHKEKFWTTKKLCDEFDDMSKKPKAMVYIPVVHYFKRRPIVWKKGYWE
jgi:hypothetical protein